jgi:hypothetical protein
MPTEKPPRLEHGAVETVDLQELGEYISKVSDTKVSLDEDQQKHVLKQAGIPVIDGKPLPKKPQQVQPSDQQRDKEVSGKGKSKDEGSV